MLLLMLILSTAAVFSAGMLFNIYLNDRQRSDLIFSIVSVIFGLYIQISMIGVVA
jgi:hypothetical protein